jgi:uncharacterized protein (UPF0335 family)
MENEPKMDIIKEADEVNNIDSNTAERLRSIIERVERLQEGIKAIQSDIRDILAEAKGVGFDVKTIRKIIRLRAMSAIDRDTQEFLLETYKKALAL